MPDRTPIFDQFSRYRVCADILRAIAPEGGTVLDVGSGEPCLLGTMLPGFNVSYVDPLLEPAPERGKYRGDVFMTAIDGLQFDFVVSVDTLEHVPPERRAAFLRRLATLARRGVVLACPCSDTGDAPETDRFLNETYRLCYGTDYPWLEEHARYGLPRLRAIREQFEQLGLTVTVRANGHTPWLRMLLGYTLCHLDLSESREHIDELSATFNRELYPYDHLPPSYRQVIVALTGGTSGPLPEQRADPADLEAAARRWEAIARRLAAYPAQALRRSQHETNRLDTQLAAARRDISQRQAQLTEREREIAGLQSEMARLQGELTEAGRTLEAERQALGALRDAIVSARRTVGWKAMIVLRRLKAQLLLGRDGGRKAFARWLGGKTGLLPPAVGIGFDPISSVPNPVGAPVAAAAGPGLERPLPSLASQEHPDVVLWGVIDWQFRIQRPQHLARGLTARGHRTFYISPEILPAPAHGFSVTPLDAAGCLFHVRLWARSSPVIYDGGCSPEVAADLRRSVARLLEWTGGRELISVVQHPFWLPVAAVLPNARLVYDCLDHHQGFANSGTAVGELEGRLLARADVVVVTSNGLFDAFRARNPHTAIVRNACDYDHFSAASEPRFRDPAGRRVIGYYGAIAEWFDLELVAHVARRFHDCLVLLVGTDSVQARERLRGLPNVCFTGEVPYDRLPFYLHGMDVCMIPFRVTPLTLATNPVKAYEYLSAGKAVVSVDLPELARFDGLIATAADPQTFCDSIAAALAEPAAAAAARRAFARHQTWDTRVTEFERAIADAPEPLVSVIIVAYNNLELTRACLESIERYSDYPALEVIIVDNASSDGTPDVLRQLAADRPRWRVICNATNRGFAAANNQGLAVAKGDYLVLLNNDTVVTPGWVRTLMAHLRNDPRLGIIGPVTNNIGNEARIAIDYADLTAMPAAARTVTLAGLGEERPLRTAAFFCVMLPRAVYEKVGALDEAFGLGFFEDDDYCRRIEAQGYRIACAEDVFIHHHLSAAFGKLRQDERMAIFERSKAVYERKWGPWTPHRYRA